MPASSLPGATAGSDAAILRPGRAPAGGWRTATVREVAHPTPRTAMIRLDVPARVDHLPGQHYVVRLTAPDGYTASRSYSVASPPSDPLIELLVERLDDGEVSGFLADVLAPGDTLEVRGPIGGWFVWDADRPAVAVGGGTGVVPLVAMLRHARDRGRPELFTMVAAAGRWADLPYAEELAAAGARIVLSREDRPERPAGRIGLDDLPDLTAGPTVFVCGSAAFAEAASSLAVRAGADEDSVRVERFGPSG
ncbi:oxidoreductase [Nakamurella flavida]|uniref:Oxidoreductase n=1 Tax=Nakamurella flavida TaxID=363630 RepID=A0A938YFW1_9ACTN|nr:FAD-binding oxidoreductase [Nakamurella flavida]MBM9475147.1 oxidoreductase [Nakamurella flavida]MDP9776717.1 ferredoxin-NADP reductase [Nakamurella flavida]